jgi:hypothetical protein
MPGLRRAALNKTIAAALMSRLVVSSMYVYTLLIFHHHHSHSHLSFLVATPSVIITRKRLARRIPVQPLVGKEILGIRHLDALATPRLSDVGAMDL